MPLHPGAAADPEDDRTQAVPVMNQDSVTDEWLAALARPGWSNEIGRRCIVDRQVSGQRGLRQCRRPKAFAGCLPQGIALKKLHPRNTAFGSTPTLDHRLQHLETVEVVGFNRAGMDRHRFTDPGAARY